MNQKIVLRFQETCNNTLKIQKKEMVKQANTYRQYLPELPEGFEVSATQMFDAWVTYPYDKFLKQEVKNRMLAAGWRLSWEITEAEAGNGQPRFQFNYDLPDYSYASIIFSFNVFKPGSTCVRKQIAEDARVIPVYEYVCGDADEQN